MSIFKVVVLNTSEESREAIRVASLKKLESPYMAVKLSNSLKGFYTLKELEKILEINSHILWRYTALINIPEKKTSQKIIEKILENNLVEKIVNKVISINSRGYVETWRYLYDVHFLGIVGYEVARFVGSNSIDTVFVYPEEDDKVILVKNIAKNWAFLKSYSRSAKLPEGRYLGIFVVVSLSDEWKKKAIEYGINNIKVLKETNT